MAGMISNVYVLSVWSGSGSFALPEIDSLCVTNDKKERCRK